MPAEATMVFTCTECGEPVEIPLKVTLVRDVGTPNFLATLTARPEALVEHAQSAHPDA
jgi:hypothetical protein